MTAVANCEKVFSKRSNSDRRRKINCPLGRTDQANQHVLERFSYILAGSIFNCLHIHQMTHQRWQLKTDGISNQRVQYLGK